MAGNFKGRSLKTMPFPEPYPVEFKRRAGAELKGIFVMLLIGLLIAGAGALGMSLYLGH
jgi:hypothetical protein